jgi:hypothetical protein
MALVGDALYVANREALLRSAPRSMPIGKTSKSAAAFWLQTPQGAREAVSDRPIAIFSLILAM